MQSKDTPRIFKRGLMDGLAISASALCLMHCLGLPILFALLPALANIIVVSESFHLAAFLVAIPASTFALIIGFRRHGLILPCTMGVIGIMFLGWGVLGGYAVPVETGLTVIGSIILASGHIWNWRGRALSD